MAARENQPIGRESKYYPQLSESDTPNYTMDNAWLGKTHMTSQKLGAMSSYRHRPIFWIKKSSAGAERRCRHALSAWEAGLRERGDLRQFSTFVYPIKGSDLTGVIP
jgi:hypothetical protein